MRTGTNRFLSLLLTLCVLMGMLPVYSHAESVTTSKEINSPTLPSVPVMTTVTNTATVTVTNNRGTLSYSVAGLREGVTVDSQQWCLNDTPISGATNNTYDMSLYDMGDRTRILSVQLTLSNGQVLSGSYSAQDRNTQWYIASSGTLSIINNYDQDNTNFPISTDDYLDGIDILEGVHVTGATLSAGMVITVSGTVNNCSLTAHTVSIENGATISGGTINASVKFNHAGTISGTSIILGSNCSFTNSDSGTIQFNITVNEVSKAVTYPYDGSLNTLLDSLDPRVEGEVWMQNGTVIDDSAKLDLSMQGASFVSVPIPMLTIKHGNTALSKTGRNDLTTRSSLSVSALNCEPTSYTWYGLVSENSYTPIGSGESFTIPMFIPFGNSNIPAAQYYGSLYCEATLADESKVQSPSYLIYLFPDQQPQYLVSNTEGKYTVGTVLSFDKNADFFSETYELKLEGYRWGSDESDKPAPNASATYTLTAADLQGGEHTITGWMYLLNQTTRQEHAYPATYTIPANNEWMLADGTLTFIGNYNAATTQFPIDGLTYSSVNTVADSVIANAAFADCTVNNSGTIYGTTFTNCTVNNSGTIHVPVTIDGSSYTSTPDSDCQYLYGANTLATLNAWYAAQHSGESTEGLIWLDASTKQEVASNATLGLNNSFILFGTMNVTIDAPYGYYLEFDLSANVTLNSKLEDVRLAYTWKWTDTNAIKSNESSCSLVNSDIGNTLELTVTATTNDGYSVTRTVQTDTVQEALYTVRVAYVDEFLLIEKREDVNVYDISSIPQCGMDSDTVYRVPLTDEKNPVYVDIKMSGMSLTTGETLEQRTQLTLNRRQTDEIAAGDFTLDIPRSGNLREVTITCTNPGKYWGIRVAGEDYSMNESGVFTVSVPVGEDVTVEARLPGSDAERLLPSLWSTVGTIPASQWLSFSVTENKLLSNDSTLYWGETLTVDTNADTLTWCINGEEVADPSTVVNDKRTYRISADVNTLTITATRNGETATYAASPMCPFTMATNYKAETITFTLQGGCNVVLDFEVSVPKYNSNHNFQLSLNPEYDNSEETMALADPHYNYDFLSLAPANLQIKVFSTNEMEDPYLFTMFYPLERFNASMENADVSITANYPTSNDEWQTVLGYNYNSERPNVIITNVELRNTQNEEVVVQNQSGELVFTTKANTTYSVWVKQVSAEYIPGKGVQFTSFVSDWLNTGLKVATGIALDRPSPIAGQTVTATSGMVCPEATETWKWERIENNSLVSVGTNANAYTISADDANRARNFNVSFRVTHTLTVNGKTYSVSATTGVLPIPQLVLKDQNGTTLTVSDTGGVLVPLGTTVTPSMTNFEGDLTWLWTSNGDSYEESSSITISTSRPCALLKDPLNPNKHLATVTCDIPAPQVTIDYVNEAFILENVPDAFAAMFSESKVFIALMDGGKKVGKISETTCSHAISNVIWENILGTRLPNNSEHTFTLRWFIGRDVFFGRTTTLTIPARPELSTERIDEGKKEIEEHLSITPYSITYTGNQDWEIGIEVDGKIVIGEALQNLEADTPYDLYYRQAASNDPTNPYFATDWVKVGKISTAPRMQLTPVFETITYAPGMSLDEDDLLTKLSFKNGGDSVPVPRAYLSLSLKEGSFPITDVGTYTVLLTTTTDFDKAYVTSKECELTIGGLDLSNWIINYSPEMTYTGSPLPLPSFSFKFYDAASSSSNSVRLTSNDYEIEWIRDGLTNEIISEIRNAGQYTFLLKCKGNYTGCPVTYVTVNPRDISKDCVVAPLSPQYDGGAQTLTVTVDGRTLTQDTDYTVLITRDNQTVTEIKEAGTYTVTLTGKGNYKGSYETTVTVSPAPLTVVQTGNIALTYNGTTAFDLQDTSVLTLSGIANGDTVSLSNVSLTLNSKDAQTAPQQAAISATLTGDDAGNYVLHTNQTCQVLVNQKEIVVVPESPKSFAYTGTTDVPMTGTGWTLEGTITNDDVALDLTKLRATVADAAVGKDKLVTITGWKLKGADSANYVVTDVTARTVTIVPAQPPTIEWPKPSTITYGDALSKSTLTADAHGTFAWQSGDIILSAGTHTQTIVYTPADTANYDYTGVTLTASANVIVNKAPAPAIVWPTASAITYGEALSASTLTSTDKNGTFAWQSGDTILSAGKQTATVVYTPADTANYDYTGVTLTATVTVTVNKAPAPAIVWPETGTAITYGDALSKSTLTADAHGTFAWKASDTILSAGTHTQTIVYTPADTANYDYTGVTLTASANVTVNKAPAPAIVWPETGTTITYDDALSASALTSTDKNGTFAWKAGDTILFAGTHIQTIVYIPADKANYDYTGVTLTATVPVTVNKAPAPAIVWPTASAITYGEALSASTLTSTDKNGTFAWQSGDTTLSAGKQTATVVYTPADTANYDYTGVTLTATVPVTVNKAPAPVIVWPTASAITYGEALSASTLTSTDKNGTFAWKAPSQTLAAGEQTATVVYTPADKANYDYTGVTLTASANVTVNKAPAPAIVWPTASAITYGDALSTSTLTSTDKNGTFAWQSGDTILSAGTHTQTVVYTPADKANYDFTGVTLTASVNVTVNKAPAPDIVWPTAKPTAVPTVVPTAESTAAPTAEPTATPTTKPTAVPTIVPTAEPTATPTTKPTAVPTIVPTAEPTAAPTAPPTAAPTAKPTAVPTVVPTAESTTEPTTTPTATPTTKPTAVPTIVPTAEPTAAPTVPPTAEPTAAPTAKPTAVPTVVPTAEPTTEPTTTPTATPTTKPTAVPTIVPTAELTAEPTATPTPVPVPVIMPEKVENKEIEVLEQEISKVVDNIIAEIQAIVKTETEAAKAETATENTAETTDETPVEIKIEVPVEPLKETVGEETYEQIVQMPVHEKIVVLLSVLNTSDGQSSLLQDTGLTISEQSKTVVEKVIQSVGSLDEESTTIFQQMLEERFPKQEVTVEDNELVYYLIPVYVTINDVTRVKYYAFCLDKQTGKWMFTIVEEGMDMVEAIEQAQRDAANEPAE